MWLGSTKNAALCDVLTYIEFSFSKPQVAIKLHIVALKQTV